VKKRILINLMFFGPGGGATHLWHLCSSLTKQGAEITVVSRYADLSTPLIERQREIPIRFISTPFAQNRSLYRLSTGWALLVWPILLGRRKYDVLYTWELSPFTRFLSYFVRPNGRTILQRIGEPLADGECLDPSLQKLLDGLIVESPLQESAARSVMSRSVPILALPLIGHCASVPGRNGHRPGEVFRITFLGRYARDKGIYRLLEIWPKLNIGKAELCFHAWGEEYEQLSRMIKELALDKQIHLNGAYSTAEELSAILAETDLVVLPSETEGLPVVLLESMAHGVPFVATDVGAVQTLAENNPDVKVVSRDNAALKEGIEEMVRAIRVGEVRSDRLQAYYEARYGYDVLSQKWRDAFLQPEQVWDQPVMLN
jgi:glycosyltransferase involved in cell wall biosynthesis